MFSILKSRTIWTAIIMYVITFGPYISAVLPPMWKALVDAVLTILIAYFHTNPSQSYTTGSVRR